MQDPPKENITGEKWDGISHTFDWGEISMAVAVIVTLLFLYWLLRDDEDDDESDVRAALGQ